MGKISPTGKVIPDDVAVEVVAGGEEDAAFGQL
jgi:hypothetical protein